MLGVLAVSGCQGEDAEPSLATAPASTPAAITDDADVTTEAARTTETPTEKADDDAALITTEPPVAEPTSTDDPTSTEDKEEGNAGDAAAAGDVIVVQDGTVFTTPAQAAFCSLSAPAGGMSAVISCEVAQGSVPPGDPILEACPSDGYGWYFNFFEDIGHVGFGCNHHDGIIHLPGVDLAGDPWVDQSQVHVLPRGTRVPILTYGRVLRAGGMSCSVQPDGLTCASLESGHGFTVNTASHVSW